jgi:hypothetical protein
MVAASVGQLVANWVVPLAGQSALQLAVPLVASLDVKMVVLSVASRAA